MDGIFEPDEGIFKLAIDLLYIPLNEVLHQTGKLNVMRRKK